jgi:hypothetical protein
MIHAKHIHRAFYHLQSNLFTIFIILTYISYIGIAIGVKILSPDSLNKLDYYTRIYVCLFLLYRFNPFRKIQFNELDRKIAFSAGVFLLSTTFINSFIQKYINLIISIVDL